MIRFNFARRELVGKVLYYGPGGSGKTSNLKYIQGKTRGEIQGRLLSLDAQRDEMSALDFLPLRIGDVGGFNIRLQLYAVSARPGSRSLRRIVQTGIDGIVFVADSLSACRQSNIESLAALTDDLQEMEIDLRSVPLVIQYNKRDLEGMAVPSLPIELMEQDLNAELRVPSFWASAIRGHGVLETLRAISKLTVKDMTRSACLEREAM
jgi:hypothetical protein